jgi:LuxR family maltose regulon positive regulatory protein
MKAEGGRMKGYVEKLLVALRNVEIHPSPLAKQGGIPHPSLDQSLVDPLSDRELDVLRLLNTDLSGPEIAAQLMVSVNTVKTHTKNIYSKLDAHGRFEAVERAKQLGLLS